MDKDTIPDAFKERDECATKRARLYMDVVERLLQVLDTTRAPQEIPTSDAETFERHAWITLYEAALAVTERAQTSPLPPVRGLRPTVH